MKVGLPYCSEKRNVHPQILLLVQGGSPGLSHAQREQKSRWTAVVSAVFLF